MLERFVNVTDSSEFVCSVLVPLAGARLDSKQPSVLHSNHSLEIQFIINS